MWAFRGRLGSATTTTPHVPRHDAAGAGIPWSEAPGDHDNPARADVMLSGLELDRDNPARAELMLSNRPRNDINSARAKERPHVPRSCRLPARPTRTGPHSRPACTRTGRAAGAHVHGRQHSANGDDASNPCGEDG
ncbi:hypothetical protein BN12_2840010 [Nostocoides japonicum T1-X7]|uniref:Uncharacterized protein n=1 Tax=Nostocoides japonicum T1-X7 TaxID=1194083 RepID=A0A077LZU7_9MICO|nr:hypothetical protein BN12_2840010 [Tetrasphaera japonica T1-X7]